MESELKGDVERWERLRVMVEDESSTDDEGSTREERFAGDEGSANKEGIIGEDNHTRRGQLP